MRLAEEIRNEDDKIDELHLSVFDKVLGETWKGEAVDTVDATLASRYHERFADHAVSIAKKVQYLATGDWVPETPSALTLDARAAPAGARRPGRMSTSAGPSSIRSEAVCYFLPCAATAAAPAAAASGSRYSPGPIGMKSSPSW